MVNFIVDMTRPDDKAIQIGDNDSGRFFKFFPVFVELKTDQAARRYLNLKNYDEAPGDATYWIEDRLNQNSLLGAAAGLFKATAGHRSTAETEIVNCLAKGTDIPLNLDGPVLSTDQFPLETELPEKADWLTQLRLSGYPDFGLYIFRSARVFMAVRCGNVARSGRGGHAHNDLLSFELSIDGIPVIVDPGTYCYSSLPDMRNKFRSTAMHNTLAIRGKEQNACELGLKGLFYLKDSANAEMMEFTGNVLEGRHKGFGEFHTRRIELFSDRIEAADRIALAGEKEIYFHFAPQIRVSSVNSNGLKLSCGNLKLKLVADKGSWNVFDDLYSAGYGQIEKSSVARLSMHENAILWTLSIDLD